MLIVICCIRRALRRRRLRRAGMRISYRVLGMGQLPLRLVLEQTAALLVLMLI